RMKAAEKADVMEAFKEGRIDLLVATTVIEVGVDVPEATLIIIENPERLGLAQLHQLRGRVGRGERASYCVLLYHPPLSDTAKARLQALRETQDGFAIAQRDLEIRGPGEVLGTRQTGLMAFRLADWEKDTGWLEEVRLIGPRLVADNERVDALIDRWLGERIRYGDV
ncbi:MAG: helicase-related protein, partial [Pseudomonadota bacterium]